MEQSPSASGNGRRRLYFRLLLPLFGVLLGCLIGEIAIRAGFATPVRQIVRGHDLRDVNGVPVWEDDGAEARENRECVAKHPERTRILFFGNSVTAGAGVEPAETFAHLLERRLNALRPTPGFCVMNFAEPGFHYDEQYAIATEMIPKYHPAIALNQDGPVSREMHLNPNWRNMIGVTACHLWHYRVVGDSAYEVNGLKLRPDGYPGMPYVPDLLNRVLFQHSLLYQYVTLARGEKEQPHEEPGDYFACREDQFMKFVSLVRASGGKAAYYLAADLSYPMNASPSFETELHHPLIAFGERNGFPVLDVRTLLSDQNNKKIKLDDWHLNPAGHRALAERLAPVMLSILDGQAVAAVQ